MSNYQDNEGCIAWLEEKRVEQKQKEDIRYHTSMYLVVFVERKNSKMLLKGKGSYSRTQK